MNYDSTARYLESHEWARPDGDHFFVGISDYAQDSLSDIVYMELPEAGATFPKGEIFGVVESVKAASDLYMPVGGEIVEINEALIDTPELINEDPFGKAWMIKIAPTDPSEYDALLEADAYQKFAEAEDH